MQHAIANKTCHLKTDFTHCVDTSLLPSEVSLGILLADPVTYFDATPSDTQQTFMRIVRNRT